MSLPLFSLILALWIVFTSLFAYEIVYRGFSRVERDEFLKRYDMWRKASMVAPLADPPAIIRRLQAVCQPFIEVALVFLVNAVVPYLLLSFFEPVLAYSVIMGLVLVEIVGILLSKRFIWGPQYRADFDHYLTLTALGNQCVEGELVERDPSREMNAVSIPLESDRFVSGGRIVALEFSTGLPEGYEAVPLFCPSKFGSLPEGKALRVFYRPSQEPIDGRVVAGKLVGWQELPESEEAFPDSSLTGEGLEQRLIEN